MSKVTHEEVIEMREYLRKLGFKVSELQDLSVEDLLSLYRDARYSDEEAY